MSSIKDVARAAGVSVSTVSHVINETRFVALETRENVERAIRELGYQPNSLARALRSKRTKTIGMLVTSSTNPFFAEVVSGVEEECFRRGYSLILCISRDQHGRQLTYLNMLMQKRIDALVIMTVSRDPDFQQALGSLGSLPKVILDSEPFPNACAIGDDSVLGGRQATDYLIERGFREIGCLTGPQNHPRSRDRFCGFEKAMGVAEQPIKMDWIVANDLTAQGGYEAMTRILNAGPQPQAVFAFNDLMALGAYRAVMERGLSIPDDISVVGYDDLEIAKLLFPALTTIRQPSFELGLEAAQILIRHLENKVEIPPQIQLIPKLIIRNSVL
ncbi:MAG: substrate-binding domain-containing protein [Gammaproteobacteria bacterium]|nr:substrate-binding domain-containing protein [Gammaproteobacteria bacterium]